MSNKFTLTKGGHVVTTSDPGEATQLRAAGYTAKPAGKAADAKSAEQAPTKPATKK